MNFNKLVAVEDFADPAFRELIQQTSEYKLAHLPAGFPSGSEHRKDWEVAMAVRALREFGALHRDATILGVGVGSESTLFYLTRHVKQVFATDLYLAAGDWDPVAPLSMLLQPEAIAPYEFEPNRLVVQHMDGRVLRYPDATFDGIFSSGSIEHFGGWQEVANAAYEMGRVLKLGGILSLSTEFRLSGPPGGVGWPGQTLLFSAEDIQRYLVEASGLELVDPLDVSVSSPTLESSRDLLTAVADHNARLLEKGGADHAAEYAQWDFPHLIMAHDGYVFTSVHIALRKTDAYPLIANDWARPSEELISSIRQSDSAVIAGRHSQQPAQDSQPQTAPAQAAEQRSWADQIAVLDQQISASVQAQQRVDQQINILHERRRMLYEWTAQMHNLAPVVDQQIEDVELTDHAARALLDGLDIPDSGSGKPRPDRMMPPEWVVAKIEMAGGIRFDMVVDPTIGDPIGAMYAAGHGIVFNELVDVMLACVSPGDFVLDLGAHLGTFALSAAAAGCHVVAIEASPVNVELLRASAALNGFHNLRVIHAAVSDKPGFLEFTPHGPWGHVASASPDTDLPVISVPAITVDELMPEVGLPQVDFIKMDVEGSELSALRGMKQLLSGTHPVRILYESNTYTLDFFGLKPNDLLAELYKYGYTSYLLDGERLVQLRGSDLQPQTEIDCLALRIGSAPPPGWTVEPPMSAQEKISRFVADSRSANPNCRTYVARALAGAGPEIVTDPAVVEALTFLVRDEEESVRSAAAWWAEEQASLKPGRSAE